MSVSRPKRSRNVESPQEDPVEPKSLLIVGIGASAGGLEAISQLLPHLPKGLGLSFVVVQHLSPTYKSMLTQLLSRETAMAVLEIEDGVSPQPDIVYITPPNRNVTLENSLFRLSVPAKEAMPKPSVNLFFHSIAEQLGDGAFGIVLSGTGSDGAHGIRAIKAAGGFTFAQSPDTAKYSGMPQAAIDTGSVDWVLSPADIGAEINLVMQNRGRFPVVTASAGAPASLKTLLAKVRTRTRVDFSLYKEPTLWRRVERRMAANHVASLTEYLNLVENQPLELDKLCKDILISVTSFFRDEEAFAVVRKAVARLVQDKSPGDDIRIWVAGCATGEEAYSLAILFAEQLGTAIDKYRIQIFATDIDMEAMAIARRGLFPAASLAHLDPSFVKTYFNPHGDQFEIHKRLRDLVVFARQDLVQDPPFLRLDLVTCRNVLIYFQAELQARLLTVFHYGLNPGGLLFLGKSESVYQQDGLFEVVDKEARLFRRAPGSALRVLPFRTEVAPFSREDFGRPRESTQTESYETTLMEAAARQFIPLAILINGKLEIRHIHGDCTGLLNVAAGKPAFDLLTLIRRELRTELQVLMRQVQIKNSALVGRPRILRDTAGRRAVRLTVFPAAPRNGEDLFIVAMELKSVEKGDKTEASHSTAADRELEDELAATKEHLQTVIEELETSNEEMQALNEEIQASNEEMQAANEELEASNEELQSTNEELATVNEELQIKSAELQQLSADLENIQNSIDYPLIVLDSSLKLTRCNRAASKQFKLGAVNAGRSVQDMALPGDSAVLLEAVAKVQASQSAMDLSIHGSDESSYTLHISPLTRHQEVLSGVILLFIDTTQLYASERAVREMRDRLMAVMNNSVSLIAVKDASGRYQFANPQYERSLGFDRGQVVGKTDYQLFSRELSDRFRESELESMRFRRAVELEESIRVAGADRHFLVVRFPLFDADGAVTGICFQATDVTDRKHAESQLRLAARVFDRAAEGVMVTDMNHRILTVNDAFVTVTGYTREEVVGSNPRILNSGKHPAEFFQSMWSHIGELGWWQGEIWNRRKNGELYLEWLSISTVKDQQGEVANYVALFSDITQVRASQSRVEFLATHDDLTGLPNRTLFFDRLSFALARASRSAQSLAVVFLDLDNFKVINDTMGHEAGDQLLRQVASRLQECLRSGDTVARLGGDEFVLLLEGTTKTEVAVLCERILSMLRVSFIVKEVECFVSASIGISMAPEDSTDAVILTRNADAAMYRAKNVGKNAYQFFTADLAESASRRLEVESGLRKALEEGGLELHYQPQVRLSDGQLVGVEALVRWRRGDVLVMPSEFIPIAEESQLIVALDRWVVSEVCRQLASWTADGLRNVRVSFNLSARHFQKAELVSEIISVVTLHGVDPLRLCLEVTEGVLADVDRAQRMLAELKDFGIRISVDDFGTGFSSLSYLKKLPISELKVDRSFVDGVGADGDDRAITTTVIDLARNMKLGSLAEGVEDACQYEALKELGCDCVQGYYVARPMPPQDLTRWLLDRSMPKDE